MHIVSLRRRGRQSVQVDHGSRLLQVISVDYFGSVQFQQSKWSRDYVQRGLNIRLQITFTVDIPSKDELVDMIELLIFEASPNSSAARVSCFMSCTILTHVGASKCCSAVLDVCLMAITMVELIVPT